jgi:hypothetical protein
MAIAAAMNIAPPLARTSVTHKSRRIGRRFAASTSLSHAAAKCYDHASRARKRGPSLLLYAMRWEACDDTGFMDGIRRKATTHQMSDESRDGIS